MYGRIAQIYLTERTEAFSQKKGLLHSQSVGPQRIPATIEDSRTSADELTSDFCNREGNLADNPRVRQINAPIDLGTIRHQCHTGPIDERSTGTNNVVVTSRATQTHSSLC